MKLQIAPRCSGEELLVSRTTITTGLCLGFLAMKSNANIFEESWGRIPNDQPSDRYSDY